MKNLVLFLVIGVGGSFLVMIAARALGFDPNARNFRLFQGIFTLWLAPSMFFAQRILNSVRPLKGD